MKEQIIRGFEEFERGKVIAIALRLPFEETVRRSLARGDPDINASIDYMYAIHVRSSVLETSDQQMVVNCRGASPEQVLNTVERIILSNVAYNQ